MKNTMHGKFHIFATGLAIFSMFFGAGNLIYPFMVGLESGNVLSFGLAGFILSAVILPLAGLVAIIQFDGNYQTFFTRLGNPVGKALIFLCMITIGPALAIPRIVMLAHTMMAPFLPTSLTDMDPVSSFLFALFFLSITFAMSYRENRIIDVLGYVTAPFVITSLSIIIIKGFISAQDMLPAQYSPLEAFTTNFIRGYETLDLAAAIFLVSIVLRIVKNRFGGTVGFNKAKLTEIGFKAGLVGFSVLALMYIGMAIISAYHAHDLSSSGDLFSELSLRILTNRGATLVATIVSLALLSTATALSAVVAEYFQSTIFSRKIGYEAALALTLILCIPLATFGLDYILELTAGPITYIGYPVIIALTICNILYKTVNFTPVKIPVALTFLIALFCYLR